MILKKKRNGIRGWKILEEDLRWMQVRRRKLIIIRNVTCQKRLSIVTTTQLLFLLLLLVIIIIIMNYDYCVIRGNYFVQ